jgi:hypothetical protein
VWASRTTKQASNSSNDQGGGEAAGGHVSHLYKVVRQSTSHLYATKLMLGPDSVAPMQHSEFEFQGPMDESKPEVAWPGTPEERVDRFGFRTALFVLVLALFVAAMWVANRPSFEKCSTLENVSERNACYEKLRDDLSKPPAKGADIPKG